MSFIFFITYVNFFLTIVKTLILIPKTDKTVISVGTKTGAKKITVLKLGLVTNSVKFNSNAQKLHIIYVNLSTFTKMFIMQN